MSLPTSTRARWRSSRRDACASGAYPSSRTGSPSSHHALVGPAVTFGAIPGACRSAAARSCCPRRSASASRRRDTATAATATSSTHAGPAPGCRTQQREQNRRIENGVDVTTRRAELNRREDAPEQRLHDTVKVAIGPLREPRRRVGPEQQQKEADEQNDLYDDVDRSKNEVTDPRGQPTRNPSSPAAREDVDRPSGSVPLVNRTCHACPSWEQSATDGSLIATLAARRRGRRARQAAWAECGSAQSLTSPRRRATAGGHRPPCRRRQRVVRAIGRRDGARRRRRTTHS